MEVRFNGSFFFFFFFSPLLRERGDQRTAYALTRDFVVAVFLLQGVAGGWSNGFALDEDNALVPIAIRAGDLGEEEDEPCCRFR